MVLFAVAGCSISIHALRVEGDRLDVALRETQLLFLSTPSGWRATLGTDELVCVLEISIHALRVEGDRRAVRVPRPLLRISIHALRVEGDKLAAFLNKMLEISIHALRVEGDLWAPGPGDNSGFDFYPRPPGGGRLAV